MKKNFAAAILLCSTFVSVAFAGVRFDSAFQGELDAKTKSQIRITSSQADATEWIVESIDECPSYPCYPADFTKVLAVVKPTLIKNQLATDGNLEIRLNEDMTLIQASGFGRGSEANYTPYSLKIKLNGTVSTVKLFRSNGFSF